LNKTPLIFVILSASLFGISLPLAKLLVREIPPVALAGLLYLGAFIGLSLYSIGRKKMATDSDKKGAIIGNRASLIRARCDLKFGFR